MTCVHLRKLYQLCQDEHLRLSGSDLIRIVCHQCGHQEVCPSTLTDQSDEEDEEDEDEGRSLKQPASDQSGTAAPE